MCLGERNGLEKKYTETIDRTITEVTTKHHFFFDNIVNNLQDQLNIDLTSVFNNVADELFNDGVNWGRIITLLAFSKELSKHFIEFGEIRKVDNIISITSGYLEQNLEKWISVHGGWVSFVNEITYLNFNTI